MPNPHNPKPLIGITTGIRRESATNFTTLVAYEANVNALERAGALPVLIPSTLSDEALRGIYDRLDGVLLPGGGDIDPKYWNEALHPTVYDIEPARDHTEITLARWAVEDDRPLFGICRGHQVFNVALGGSLIQDIPSLVENPLAHANFRPAPRDLLSHSVSVLPGSRLASIVGNEANLPVNSIHHQSVRDVPNAAGVVVTAESPDGIIEATEIPGKRFALSVQWHPEDLTADEQMFNLFCAFVQAARE